MNTASRIPAIDLATLLALGEAPCTDCQHRDRCGNQNDQLACRDFAVGFVERGIVKEEYRLPARYWWLRTQDIDDDTSCIGRSDGLPPDWERTYWRGVSVGASTRADVEQGRREARAWARRDEIMKLQDRRLIDVFDCGVADADQHKPRTATEWRDFCKLSGPAPVGSPALSGAVRAAITRVAESQEPVAVFLCESGINVLTARLAENNPLVSWDEHVGTYHPRTFSPAALIEDLALCGVT